MSKTSQAIGKEFSREEALDILNQCHLLRLQIDELEERALDCLEVELVVIDGGKIH